MLKHKFNDLLSIKLVRRKTLICIKNRKFDVCSVALLNIPIDRATSGDIESIDDVIKEYGGYEANITPEESFFVHKSNLQAWIDNNYDPKLLDSKLSFNILKELSKYDIEFFFILLEELDYRYENANQNIRKELIKEHRWKALKLIENLKLTKYKVESSHFLKAVLDNEIARCKTIYMREKKDYYEKLYYPIKWERILAEKIRERNISIVSSISDYLPYIWSVKDDWKEFDEKGSPQYNSIRYKGLLKKKPFKYYPLENFWKGTRYYVKAIVKFEDGSFEIYEFREKSNL